MKIVLVGYMASGKTTVGKLLAEALVLPFIDLDAYIVQQQKKSVAKIFEDQGEFFFRQLEGELLKKVLDEHDDVVLATGGGTPCYGLNMDAIVKHSDHSIYLQVPTPTLVERIEKEKAQRPLVSTIVCKDLLGFVQHHLVARTAFYESAKHTVKSGKKTAATLVVEIRALLP